jgi:hypothetical protein
MIISLTAKHRDDFEKRQHIAFEELLPAPTVRAINLALDRDLSRRIGMPKRAVPNASHKQQTMAGRDLWRNEPTIKKTSAKKEFAKTMAELLSMAPLRLAYDQLLIPKKTGEKGMYAGNHTIKELSSFEGILGGMIICIRSAEDSESEQVEEGAFFPHQVGTAVFFEASCRIPFGQLHERAEGFRYLLVAYGRKDLNYVQNGGDPHVGFLQKLGYSFGDQLNRDHPILVLNPES